MGSSSPENSSSRKYLARSSPRIDFSRMASVPTAKLIPATMKKLSIELTKKAAKWQAGGPAHGIHQKKHDGGRNGQQREPEHGFAQGPRHHEDLHVHRLDEVHHQRAFRHLGREVLVDVVVIERADDPADRNVGEDLSEVEALDVRTVGKDRPPDEIVDRDVNEVGHDAGVVAQAVG